MLGAITAADFTSFATARLRRLKTESARKQPSKPGRLSRVKGTAGVKRVSDPAHLQTNHAILNGVLEVPYCADSGADQSCMTTCLLSRLTDKDAKVKTTTLDKPIICTLANSVTATVH